jgi:tryptophan 2,3-dioxygenase
MSDSHPPTYWDYLRLPDLLNLQGGLEGNEDELHNDEVHFIVVHQAFELWFKLTIREIRLARDHLAAPHVPEQHIPHVVQHLRRVNTILRLCGQQFEVMETLTPQDFLAFRDKLIPASGFQSFQMREIEILLGLLETQRVDSGFGNPLEAIRRMGKGTPTGAIAIAHLERAQSELSLRKSMQNWLYRTPIQGSTPDMPGDDDAVRAFVTDYLAAMDARSKVQAEQLIASGVMKAEVADEKFARIAELARAFLLAEDVEEGAERARRIRAAILFIESYRELPLLAWPRVLLDTIVETEEMLVIFRSRHARMVERVIGRRMGTGGSSGVDYLDKTTAYRIFTDLWSIRTLLLPKDALPPMEFGDTYGFADS